MIAGVDNLTAVKRSLEFRSVKIALLCHRRLPLKRGFIFALLLSSTDVQEIVSSWREN